MEPAPANGAPASSASTVGRALAELEAQLFVGREVELAAFRTWIGGTSPEILAVHGPGGVGKSELLRAFGRVAAGLGRPVVAADGRDLRPTPADLLAVLGGSTVDEVVARLNAARPLVLLDTFEELGGLTRFLQRELLPWLNVDVRVAVAGRHPLGRAWERDGAWRMLIRPMPLDGFTLDEAREYLVRRGLDDPALAARVREAAGGHPLALSLAADLALQLGVRNLIAAPEWRVAVHGLVEQLVAGLDADTRELLEAGAVVRNFDEALLEAMTGRPTRGDDFGRLCRLSIVRPTSLGLALHDDARRLLAEDLRFRRPDRHAELRRRATRHLGERMRSAQPAERERLLAERLALWEHAFVQATLFRDDDPGPVWLEPMQPRDIDELLEMQRFYQVEIASKTAPSYYYYDVEYNHRFMERLFRYPGSRVRVARDSEGRMIGFNLVLPICRESWPLIADHRVLGPAVTCQWPTEERAALPGTPAETDIYYLLQVAHAGVTPDVVFAAVWRDLFSVLARGGAYVTIAGIPPFMPLFEALGFERIPGSDTTEMLGPEYPLHGFILDLRRIGVEAWMDALMAGRRPPRLPGAAELARELRRVLPRWGDDDALVASSLMVLPRQASPAAAGEASEPGPAALRRLIVHTLEAVEADGPEENRLACRAVALAYFDRSRGVDGAAAELAVSRRTFYRLLGRGVTLLARELARPPGQT